MDDVQPQLPLVQQLSQQVNVAGIIWAASQLLSAKPLSLSVPTDVGEVSFPLTGMQSRFVQVIASALSSLLDFLGVAHSSSAGGTALVRGQRFLFHLLLFCFFLGQFAPAGSQRRVAIGVVVNFGLLGGSLSAGAFATSLSGRSVVVTHTLELGECSGGFGTEHRFGF